MGLFRTIHGARVNVTASLALCGFYVLAAVWMDYNGVPGLGLLGLAFLAVLVLYGLWTDSPYVVLLTLGTVSFLWILGASGNPDLAPQLRGRPLVPVAYIHTLAPVAAAGTGILLRAWLFKKRGRTSAPQPRPESVPR